MQKSTSRKLVTGYILYSSEVRKQVVQNNPESTFGDISRIVGNEWRSLPAGEKQAWEERAAKCNEENALKMQENDNCASPAPMLQLAPLPDQVRVRFMNYEFYLKRNIYVVILQYKVNILFFTDL